MSNNAQIVRDYLQIVWNEGRTEEAGKYVAENLIQHNPNLADGRKTLTDFIDATRQQIPELRFTLRRLAAEGDLVFAHTHFVPAPGQLGLSVIDVFRIDGGLIVEHWDVNEAVPETTASGREIV